MRHGLESFDLTDRDDDSRWVAQDDVSKLKDGRIVGAECTIDQEETHVVLSRHDMQRTRVGLREDGVVDLLAVDEVGAGGVPRPGGIG